MHINSKRIKPIAIMGMTMLLVTFGFVVQAQQKEHPDEFNTQPPPIAFPNPPADLSQQGNTSLNRIPPQEPPLSGIRQDEFKENKRERPNINFGRSFMRTRQFRVKQMLADLEKLFTEEELAFVPTFKIPIKKFIETNNRQSELIARREKLLYDSSNSKEERVDKFHQLLKEEEALQLERKQTVDYIKSNLDKITTEVTTRRDQLRKKIYTMRCNRKPLKQDEMKQVRRLVMLSQQYEQIEDTLSDIDSAGDDPMSKMLVRNLQRFPNPQELNTTAAKYFLPQLRELHNRQEQLLREASEIDMRLSEIEDLLKLATE